jgi:hypothetical protein|tara:strand:+ start:535 stop:807 length:273 start_codon:yes stop_codon:yes gene_type:complete
MKKDLEIYQLHEKYLVAQGDLHNALEERMQKVSDDNGDLWDLIYTMQRCLDKHKIDHIERFIYRMPGVILYNDRRMIDYSDLSEYDRISD